MEHISNVAVLSYIEGRVLVQKVIVSFCKGKKENFAFFDKEEGVLILFLS